MSLATKKMVTRFSKQVEANEEDEGGEIDLFSRNRQSALYLAQKVLIQRWNLQESKAFVGVSRPKLKS